MASSSSANRGSCVQNPYNSSCDLKTPFSEAKLKWRYTNQDQKFMVVSVSRYCLTAATAKLARLLRPSSSMSTSTGQSPTDVIYMGKVLLMRDNCQFDVAFLHPKYDLWIITNKLKLGSVICVNEFVKCGRPLQAVDHNYIEICDMELKPLDSEWKLNVTVLMNHLRNVESEHLPIQGMIHLNPWFDMVPCWSMNNQSVLKRSGLSVECDADYLKQFQNELSTIAEVTVQWLTDPSTPSPLLVRVLRKSRILFYVPPNEEKNFPTKSQFDIADKSGSCVLVMWDHANKHDLYSNIHIGSVLLIQNFRLKKCLDSRFADERSTSTKYPYEVIVDKHSNNRNIADQRDLDFVQLVKHSETVEQLGLPKELYNFVQFTDQSSLSQSITVDISGIIVGISRLYRVSPLKKGNAIGKTFAFRLFEIYDIRNKVCHQVEIFISDQLKSFEELNLGDKVVLTFLRSVFRKSFSVDVEIAYFTSTMYTEIFLMPYDDFEIDDPRLKNYPMAIVLELRSLKMATKNTWIGGANWFTWACLHENSVNQIISGTMNFHGSSLKTNLQNLLYFECRSFGLNGIIARIDYCSTLEIRLKYLPTEINQKEAVSQSVNKIFEMPDFQNIMRDVGFVGSTHPNVLTFPVRGFTEAADIVRDSCRFPATSMLEVLQCNRIDHFIRGGDFMCRRFFRILLLSEDRKCAVWCIFMPPPPMFVKKTPKTLLDILFLKYKLNGNIGGSFAHCDFMLSDSALHLLANSGRELINRPLTFVIQAYKNSYEDTELILCYCKAFH